MTKRILILATILTLTMAHAATNDLTGLLQQGLFEEEANRNLDAAISNYQSLANAFDKDRQVAATAIFRLGECYRKLGNTNEAAAQYQRIVHEFSDQQTLVTLSQQNLAGLGASAQSATQTESSALSEQARELELVKKLQAMPLSEVLQAGPTLLTDATLINLIYQYNQTELNLIRLRTDHGEQHPEVMKEKTMESALQDKIKERLEGIAQALSLELGAAQNFSESTTRTGSVLSQLMQTREAQIEARTLQDQYNRFKGMTKAELRIAIEQNYPNPVLTKLMQEEADASQQLVKLKADYDVNHPRFVSAKEVLDAIDKQIDEQVDGAMKDLEAKMNEAFRSAQRSQQQISSFQPTANAQPPITDEEENEIRRIQAMIQNSPDLINTASDQSGGLTPLGYAAVMDWLRVAGFLLDHGAKVDAAPGGNTPLLGAAEHANKGMVELLISRGADVNAKAESSLDAEMFGQTALHIAAAKGFLAVAQTLLDHKANVNARDGRQRTPLHLASAKARVEIIKLLLAHDADVNAKDEDDATPLSDAVHSKSLEAVNVILAAKPQLEVVDKSGRTPLAIAAGNGYVEIVKALLAAKADPNAGSKNLPLFGAIRSGSDRTNITALLLWAGADPNKVAPIQLPYFQNPQDRSAIQTAVTWREGGLVKLLLEYGGDANANYVPGNITLLQQAAINIDLETAKALLAKRADANAATSDGNTALHFAVGFQDLLNWDANSNRLELVKLLLECHANPNVQNNGGKTPLDLLKEKLGQNAFTSPFPDKRALARELADLLREHGALDELPDFSAIRVTRDGLPAPIVVFQRQSNDWNHYTLLETLLQFYTPKGVIEIEYPSSSVLKFPDLTRIIIHRPDRKTIGKQREIRVNLLNATNGIDCGKDIPLEFGDMVEVPARDYTLGEEAVGLTQPQLNGDVACLMRKVRLNAHGESRELTLYSKWAYLNQALDQPEARNLLLASSDLTRVKVSRKDPATGKTQEFIVDTARHEPPEQGLFLKDGDVIDVPEKAGE